MTCPPSPLSSVEQTTYPSHPRSGVLTPENARKVLTHQLRDLGEGARAGDMQSRAVVPIHSL